MVDTENVDRPEADTLVMRSAPNAIVARFRAERSMHGFKLSVLKSALQKYIRRGNNGKAMWCARELFFFRYAPEPDGRKRIQTNFRHRLMIITLEDVGLGAPEIWSAAWGWNKTFSASTIAAWVDAMARAPKSRACSHYNAACSQTGAAREVALAYPKIAALHSAETVETRPGKSWWVEEFADALARRDPAAGIWAHRIVANGDPKRVYGRRKPVWQVFKVLEAFVPKHYHKMAMEWYKELEACKEAYLCWFILVLAHVWRVEWPAGDLDDEKTASKDDDEKTASKDDVWGFDHAVGTIEMDSFVYDLHTGARTGVVQFALEGALVTNENSGAIHTEWKRFYEDLKRHSEGIFVNPLARAPPALLPPGSSARPPALLRRKRRVKRSTLTKEMGRQLNEVQANRDRAKLEASNCAPAGNQLESSAYDFVLRTQLTTSRSKTDVYFATAKDVLYVVKGPLRDVEDAHRAIQMARWKKTNGLPAVVPQLVHLLPDLWAEGVPLGVRNGVDRSKPAPFLVAESLTPLTSIRRRMHKSKLWPLTEVVDPVATGCHLDSESFRDKTLTNIEIADYVHALLARYLFGISDLADRNFIRARGRIYSIDEETRKYELNFMKELRIQRCKTVVEWIEDNWTAVHEHVSAWIKIPEARKSFWETLCERENCLKLFLQ